METDRNAYIKYASSHLLAGSLQKCARFRSCCSGVRSVYDLHFVFILHHCFFLIYLVTHNWKGIYMVVMVPMIHQVAWTKKQSDWRSSATSDESISKRYKFRVSIYLRVSACVSDIRNCLWLMSFEVRYHKKFGALRTSQWSYYGAPLRRSKIHRCTHLLLNFSKVVQTCTSWHANSVSKPIAARC